MKIQKYEIPPMPAHGTGYDLLPVHMPLGARVLTVGVEVRPKPVQTAHATHDVVAVLWCAVDPAKKHTTRKFAVLPTGLDVPDEIAERLEFVGRIEVQRLVFHVFESTSPRLIT